MTTIKTHCPACGDVSLTPGDIELQAEPDEGSGSYYVFDCPECRLHVRKHADAHIVRLLRSAGVAWRGMPPAPRYRPPPLTYDDLLDLHDLLETDTWFGELRDLIDK